MGGVSIQKSDARNVSVLIPTGNVIIPLKIDLGAPSFAHLFEHRLEVRNGGAPPLRLVKAISVMGIGVGEGGKYSLVVALFTERLHFLKSSPVNVNAIGLLSLTVSPS